MGGHPQPHRHLPAPMVPALPTARRGADPCRGLQLGRRGAAGTGRDGRSLARGARRCGAAGPQGRSRSRTGEAMGKGQPRVGVTHREGSAAFGLPRPCCAGGQTARVPQPGAAAGKAAARRGRRGQPPPGSPRGERCSRSRTLSGRCPRTLRPRAPPAQGSHHQDKPSNQGDNPVGRVAECGRDRTGRFSSVVAITKTRTLRPPQHCCRGFTLYAQRPLVTTHGRKATPCSYTYRDRAAAAHSPISGLPYRDCLACFCSASRPPHLCPPLPPGSHPFRTRGEGGGGEPLTRAGRSRAGAEMPLSSRSPGLTGTPP